MDRMKEELLKNKLDQFLRQALEELKEEVKEQEQEQEEKIIVTITKEKTSIQGVGNPITLLNGVIALANALNKEGITNEEIITALAIREVARG